ncbi:MAG: hypothetical protein NW223_14190 [Hyphomicrobiaceae bacterium]|nr:hypothetical protein [Hyphomicrobiaceae bacterium]
MAKRMEEEKAARRGCKISICDIARNKKADGPDVTCDVVKTWAASELKDKVLKGKFDWPWGHAQCKAKINLERKVLAQVQAGTPIEVKLSKHPVKCELDQKDGKDKYALSFTIAPTVSFKDGKATKAALNWSDIDGAAVAKAAVWSTATLDNNLGVLEGVTVDIVNSFFKDQCEEVKDELGK